MRNIQPEQPLPTLADYHPSLSQESNPLPPLAHKHHFSPYQIKCPQQEEDNSSSPIDLSMGRKKQRLKYSYDSEPSSSAISSPNNSTDTSVHHEDVSLPNQHEIPPPANLQLLLPSSPDSIHAPIPSFQNGLTLEEESGKLRDYVNNDQAAFEAFHKLQSKFQERYREIQEENETFLEQLRKEKEENPPQTKARKRQEELRTKEKTEEENKKRQKNNQSAKKSRDGRKEKELVAKRENDFFRSFINNCHLELADIMVANEIYEKMLQGKE